MKQLPQQAWYDSLRQTDDGSFSKVTTSNLEHGTDPIDYQARNMKLIKEQYLKQKD